MRIICSILTLCFAFKNVMTLSPTKQLVKKISPRTSFNTCIYHYNPRYDVYRYGSKGRKTYKKKYYHLVQDHHIIPKELKEHPLIKTIDYDINSSNNLVIMPTLQGIIKLRLNDTFQTHYKGHSKYNSFVKKNMNTINKSYYLMDDKKYYFWLFFSYLKKNCPRTDSDIPWL